MRQSGRGQTGGAMDGRGALDAIEVSGEKCFVYCPPSHPSLPLRPPFACLIQKIDDSLSLAQWGGRERLNEHSAAQHRQSAVKGGRGDTRQPAHAKSEPSVFLLFFLSLFIPFSLFLLFSSLSSCLCVCVSVFAFLHLAAVCAEGSST